MALRLRGRVLSSVGRAKIILGRDVAAALPQTAVPRAGANRTNMAPSAADYARAREAFNYFTTLHEDSGVTFLENAGGSQVPRCVVGAISEFFSHHCAQLGAGYGRSQRAARVVADTHSWLELLMGTRGQGQVVIGPSTSQLSYNLASTFADVLDPGDVVVLQEASHESVVGPWVRVAARIGCEVRWWRADPRSGASRLDELRAALEPATRLVVVTHVSNLTGEIMDLSEVVRIVRQRAPAAQVVADGVAYAPHRAMDVAGWGVDWYLWSPYKVYGPHVGVMYGRRQAYDSLRERGGVGPNHYFVPDDDMSYKFELGGANHEACAGLLALQDYLLHLLGGQQPQQGQEGQSQGGAPSPSNTRAPAAATPLPAAAPTPTPGRGVILTRPHVESAFELMTAMEQPLQELLLSYLAAHPAVRLVGSAIPDSTVRVPTISFVHRRKSSRQVAAELQAAGFAVRCGHMYSRRLVEAMAAEGGLLAEVAAERQQADGEASERCGSGEPAAAAGACPGVRGAAGCEKGTRSPYAAPAGDGPAGSGGAAMTDKQRLVDEGVVRVSLLHYNTPEEVEALIAALGAVL